MVIYIILNSNNVIKGWSTTTLENSIEVETNIDFNNNELVNNYQLIENKLIQLTDDEKARFYQGAIEVPTLEERIESVESAISILMEV